MIGIQALRPFKPFGVGITAGVGRVVPAVPVNTVLPAITGTPTVDETLTVSDGAWTIEMAKTYQWRRDGTPIVGATANSYLLVEDDESAMIDCGVTNGGVTAYAVAVGPVEAAGPARRYPTLVAAPGSQYPEIVQSQPALKTPVQFGDLETMVVRISDANNDRHNYSTRQAFNADQTVCLLNGNGESVWLDTSDWSEILRGGPALYTEFADPVDPDLWWGSQNWTNQIGRYKLSTNTLTTWVVPPESGAAYSEVHIGQAEGAISNDGRYIPVVCQRGDGNTYVAIWDTTINAVENTLTLTGWSIGSGDFDNALISQSGEYLIVTSLKSGKVGHIVYDRATLTELHTFNGGSGRETGHADIGYRADTGDECLVRIATVGSSGALVSVRLSDGDVRTECTWPYFNPAGHVSCRNIHRPGYAYYSAMYASGVSSTRYYREIFSIKLDGSGQIERWGQSMFPTSSAYEVQAKATVSPYGDIVLMASGWGTTTPREYVLYVPEVMPEPPEGNYGPELVVNGDFSDGTTGWTTSSGGVIDVVDGWLEVTGPDTGFPQARQGLTFEIGKIYRIKYTARKGADAPENGSLQYWNGTNKWGPDISSTEPVTHVIEYTAIAEPCTLQLLAEKGGPIYWKDFSVREILDDE